MFSVPKGSIFGPVLYSTYVSTLEETVNNVTRTTNNDDQVGTKGEKPNNWKDVNINLHGFVDDHAMKKSFRITNDDSNKLRSWNVYIRSQSMDGSQQVRDEWREDRIYNIWLKTTTQKICHQ